MASYTPHVKEILRAHGCHFERPGRGDHEIWYSPITQRRFPVYRKTPLRDWAVPDFMVTPSRSLKVTSMRTENLLHVRGVAGHQKVRTSLSSCWYSTWKLAVRSL